MFSLQRCLLRRNIFSIQRCPQAFLPKPANSMLGLWLQPSKQVAVFFCDTLLPRNIACTHTFAIAQTCKGMVHSHGQHQGLAKHPNLVERGQQSMIVATQHQNAPHCASIAVFLSHCCKVDFILPTVSFILWPFLWPVVDKDIQVLTHCVVDLIFLPILHPCKCVTNPHFNVPFHGHQGKSKERYEPSNTEFR